MKYMTSQQDEIPLQEIIYKPTVKDNASAVLKPESKSAKLNCSLYLIAVIANLLSFATGTTVSWITPVIPKLNGTGGSNPLQRSITTSEEAWLGGLMPLGALFGPLAAGKIADKIGRKKMLLILACLHILSLLITVYAKTIPLFYISRFMAGVALGAVFNVLPVFLIEISEIHNRGALGCSMNIFLTSGLNFALIFGSYSSVPTFSLICLCPLLMFLPCFFILSPESPSFLASFNNDLKRLEACLRKLRNATPEEIHLEAKTILEASQESSQNRGGYQDLLENKVLRKALFIALTLITLQQSAGLGAIVTYMPKIFESAKVSFPPEVCVIIVGSAQVIGTVFSTMIVDRLGRKILLLSSCLGTSITLVALGSYFYMKNHHYEIEEISWLPIVSLVLYILGFSIGLGPVPWVIIPEIFPAKVRSSAASLTSFTCFLMTFIVTVTFPSLSLSLGMSKCFFLFSVFPAVGTVLIYRMVPETKGKSLQEIQKFLGG